MLTFLLSLWRTLAICLLQRYTVTTSHCLWWRVWHDGVEIVLTEAGGRGWAVPRSS